MKHEAELELKTIVTKEQFDKLASFYPDAVFIKQVNSYYVTNDISHYAFRVREKENQKLFTLKQYINGEVIEHEKLFSGNLEDDPEIKETLISFKLNPPYIIFGRLITYRAEIILDNAELCLDINEYNGITDYEIEYEVTKEHNHLASFKNILSQADIEYIPSKMSKYKRCLSSTNSLSA